MDPPDWDEFAALSHRMVDDMLNHLRTLRQRPAWQEPPADVRDKILNEPLPLKGQVWWPKGMHEP